MNHCGFEDISFQSVLHELPPGHPDIEANVWLLLLSSTCRLPAWLCASIILPWQVHARTIGTTGTLFHSIPSCLFLSFFYQCFLFASPPSLSLSLCPELFLWLSLNPYPHLHLLLLSFWLSDPIVFTTHPFSIPFLPIYSPSLHLLAQLLFYSAGWGVGTRCLNEFQCRLFMI